MRTVVYARFSDEVQNPRSIEDQMTVCRERADKEGWEVVDVFSDYAIRGSAGLDESQRPGMAALLARVAAGGIDQVLTEDTDRIARHQGDSFKIYEHLRYHGARLFTLALGEVDEIASTFKGLMDAQYSKTLGKKIKRGQRGTVAQGRCPAGLAYGYKMANQIDPQGRAVRGLREIDEEQAAVVRRIFQEFSELGLSARTIASRLNADGVPGPRGSHWRASTINGDASRGNGILRNELYIGRLVFNRTSKVTEPTTRTIRIRPNPPEEHIVQLVPELRIIEDSVWAAIKTKQTSFVGTRPERAVRPRRMLSGLGSCGVCGQGWIVIGQDRWGCTKHKADGSCTNTRQITTGQFERRVLAGLSEHMLDPELIAIYVREYHDEYGRRMNAARRDAAKLGKREADAAARVNRLVEAVAGGGRQFKEITKALAEASDELAKAREALAEQEALPVVALHPAVAADYRKQVEQLNEAVLDPAARDKAVPAVRALIDRIIVKPKPHGRGVSIEVEGRLAAILELAGGKRSADQRTFAMERVKGIEPSS